MRFRQWALFILLNIVVSAAATWLMLMQWERTHPLRVYTALTPPAVALATGAPVEASPVPLASPVPPRPTASPTLFPHTIYVVQGGDTLSAISRRFDVPLATLLVANGLTIDTVLHVGQEIKVPVSGQAVPTAVASALPTSPSSELAPVAEISVEIRQIIGRGDPNREAVVIANLGRPINLLGWRLADKSGLEYTFPDLTLWPGGTITLHTGSGPDSVSDLYWGRTAPVWSDPADEATLLDADGAVKVRHQLP